MLEYYQASDASSNVLLSLDNNLITRLHFATDTHGRTWARPRNMFHEYSRNKYDKEEERLKTEAHERAMYPTRQAYERGGAVPLDEYFRRRIKIEDSLVRPVLEHLRLTVQKEATLLNKEYDRLIARAESALIDLEDFKRDHLGISRQ